MSALVEVLRAHRADEDTSYACWGCGWRNGDWLSGKDTSDHADHLADVVLAWVAGRAGDAAVRHSLAHAIAGAGGSTHDPDPDGYGDNWLPEGDAALAAFVGTLGGGGDE